MEDSQEYSHQDPHKYCYYWVLKLYCPSGISVQVFKHSDFMA